jgi:hypothetical protein
MNIIDDPAIALEKITVTATQLCVSHITLPGLDYAVPNEAPDKIAPILQDFFGSDR